MVTQFIPITQAPLVEQVSEIQTTGVHVLDPQITTHSIPSRNVGLFDILYIFALALLFKVVSEQLKNK